MKKFYVVKSVREVGPNKMFRNLVEETRLIRFFPHEYRGYSVTIRHTSMPFPYKDTTKHVVLSSDIFDVMMLVLNFKLTNACWVSLPVHEVTKMRRELKIKRNK